MSSPIQRALDEWYGMSMPCRIVDKKTEIEEFENDHPEIAPALWEFVNHDVRVWRMWVNDVIDIVVVYGGRYVLVQDICYVAAYPDAESWHRAVFELLKTETNYFVVHHEE